MVGKSHWEAARLSATILYNWDAFEAEQYLAHGRQGDPWELYAHVGFARFLNLFYHWMIRGADEKERMRIDAHLEKPPPWADPDHISEKTAAADAAAFMAAASSGGTGVRTRL